MRKAITSKVINRDGKIYARLVWWDVTGKRHDIQRVADNQTQAKRILAELKEKIETSGQRDIHREVENFEQLACYFEEHVLIEAQYVEGRKVAGLRSTPKLKPYLRALRAHFGKTPLNSITHQSLMKFRQVRLQTPTFHGRQRQIASVNRELALMRKMLGTAVREGWMKKNPFQSGDPLISAADERKRERILSFEEEKELLNQCNGPRSHLRPIIICALDTGLRRGEILSLKWSDVDFGKLTIKVQAENAKTMKERLVPMSKRLRAELDRLHEFAVDIHEGSVFGITDNFKCAFATALRRAKITGLRFHDLRHTFASRMVGAGLPLAELARILGHASVTTTYRYTNTSNDSLKRATNLIDSLYEDEVSVQTPLKTQGKR